MISNSYRASYISSFGYQGKWLEDLYRVPFPAVEEPPVSVFSDCMSLCPPQTISQYGNPTFEVPALCHRRLAFH